LWIGGNLFFKISVTKAFGQQNILIVDNDYGETGNFFFQPDLLSIGLNLGKNGAQLRIILVHGHTRRVELGRRRCVKQKK
jgi:hypothetical protein